MGRNSIKELWTNNPTRRGFLASLVAGSLQAAQPPADINLQIAPATLDVAPGHTVSTTAYNVPFLRLREGTPVTVDIFNRTDRLEYVPLARLRDPCRN